MDPAHFNTPIVAELFAAQGKPARAIGILRHVVKSRPDDQKAAARLAELEAQVGAAASDATGARGTLEELVTKVGGATACALLSIEGKMLDCYEVGGSGLDVPSLLSEYTAAARLLRQSGQAQPLAGQAQECVVATARLTVVMVLLSSDHLVAMVLGPDGLSGKARYLLRQMAPQLRDALTQPT